MTTPLGTLTVNVNLTDDQLHQVEIYMVDWDHLGRQQIVQVSSADTGAILDTRTVSNFEDGQWLVWNLQGHVKISITSDVPGMSAVISGLLLDPANTLRPGSSGQSHGGRRGRAVLQWSANQEDDLAGYNVYRRSSSSGPFVQLNASGPLTSPSYTDASPPFGVVCYYRVVAVDTGGHSSFPSSVVSPSTAEFLAPTQTPRAIGSGPTARMGIIWAATGEASFRPMRCSSLPGNRTDCGKRPQQRPLC